MTSVPRMLGFAIAIAIAIGLGTLSFAPGFAQETTTTPEPPAPAEVVPGDGATTDGLSMGTEVDTTGIATAETAVVGQTYVAARFDLWEQRCAKAADGSDPCQFLDDLVFPVARGPGQVRPEIPDRRIGIGKKPPGRSTLSIKAVRQKKKGPETGPFS